MRHIEVRESWLQEEVRMGKFLGKVEVVDRLRRMRISWEETGGQVARGKEFVGRVPRRSEMARGLAMRLLPLTHGRLSRHGSHGTTVRAVGWRAAWLGVCDPRRSARLRRCGSYGKVVQVVGWCAAWLSVCDPRRSDG